MTYEYKRARTCRKPAPDATPVLPLAPMNNKAVPIWEVWNWTQDDRVLFGVTLLLIGAFAAGWITGLETHDHENERSLTAGRLSAW